MVMRIHTSGTEPNSGAATRMKINESPHNEESSIKRSASAVDMAVP
jgi:hypothetical protein